MIKLSDNLNILQITVNNTGILFSAQITSFMLTTNLYECHLGLECLEILLFVLLLASILSIFEYSGLRIISIHKYDSFMAKILRRLMPVGSKNEHCKTNF
jgi:hypothetical protein